MALACAGAKVPTGPLAVVPDAAGLSLTGKRLSGRATDVPWARTAHQVVALVEDRVVSIDPASLNITAGADLAGMPRDTVEAIDLEVDAYEADVDVDAVLLRGPCCALRRLPAPSTPRSSSPIAMSSNASSSVRRSAPTKRCRPMSWNLPRSQP